MNEDYELVPEGEFQDIKKNISDISKSPFVSDPHVKEMGDLLKAVNNSLVSLLDVLRIISDQATFDETEKTIVKSELMPVVKEVKEIKEQNDIIVNTMKNITDRMDDIQFQLNAINKELNPVPASEPNPNLPPLKEGMSPPNQDGGFQNLAPPK